MTVLKWVELRGLTTVESMAALPVDSMSVVLVESVAVVKVVVTAGMMAHGSVELMGGEQADSTVVEMVWTKGNRMVATMVVTWGEM
jgi:hypothetical protein